jgi:hypothetical protein
LHIYSSNGLWRAGKKYYYSATICESSCLGHTRTNTGGIGQTTSIRSMLYFSSPDGHQILDPQAFLRCKAETTLCRHVCKSLRNVHISPQNVHKGQKKKMSTQVHRHSISHPKFCCPSWRRWRDARLWRALWRDVNAFQHHVAFPDHDVRTMTSLPQAA